MSDTLKPETAEWPRLFQAMSEWEKSWDAGEGGDNFALTMSAAMEAWKAYREARFGRGEWRNGPGD